MKGISGIYGNETIKKQLKESLERGRVEHAYIIAGEKGIGKKTLAMAFVTELFCKNRDPVTGEPCLICAECKRVQSGNHPDVCMVSHGKTESLGVEDIRRQIVDTVDIRPFSSPYKVYIIPDAGLMTTQAQNALLKTLEEPPGYAVFLLLANDEKELLDTVRSRMAVLRMKPLMDSAVRDCLREHYGAEGEKLEICVAFSRGNLGRAIELYTSGDFSEWYQRLMQIIKNIKNMDAADIRIAAAKLINACPDLMDALDFLELWYRDLTLYMVTRDMNGLVFYGEAKTLMAMARTGSCQSVQEIVDRIEVCRKRLKAHVNPELSLELLFLTMKEK